ncbi:DUF2087 domain-containing protein [Niveispirillum fermenti]|uniref:DUF2087 domain-containing protein n=1 Tax=Niveispirillum fermenti TaxID=1233113 RepID=UPI003A8963E1
MSKQHLSFQVTDIGALAKSLKSQIGVHEGPLGHVHLLNMLARGAGYRNFQHYRTQAVALERLEQPPSPVAPGPEVDLGRIRRLLRHFDEQGRLVRWPNKFNEQATCLWVIWSRLPARTSFTERGISKAIQAEHLFGDFALLRRELVEQGLVSRTPDCRDYRRIERAPPADARTLIHYLAPRLHPRTPAAA